MYMKDQLPPLLPDDASDAEEMANVVKALKVVDDPDEREALLIQLAECGLRNHDFTDMLYCEHVHTSFAELQVAQQSYRMAALRVGRTLFEHLPDQVEDHDCGEADGITDLN